MGRGHGVRLLLGAAPLQPEAGNTRKRGRRVERRVVYVPQLIYVIVLHPPQYPGKQVSPRRVYRWRNRGSERLSDEP